MFNFSVVWSRVEQETNEKMDLSLQTLIHGESIFSPGVLLKPGDKVNIILFKKGEC